jgi:hypothetical protein
MPDLSYVTRDWEDQAAFLDNTLEMWGIPPSLIRMVQSGAKSGLAIQSEQLPILGWVEGRRADWGCYEESAAETGLKVAESHLDHNGFRHDADQLQAVLDDWSFSLRWPSLYIQLPGPDRDVADDWRLAHSLVSLVGLAQERMDLTEEEAFELLGKVAEQNRRLRAMGINPTPAAGMGALGGPTTGEDLGGEGAGDGALPGLADPLEAEGSDFGESGDSPDRTDSQMGLN